MFESLLALSFAFLAYVIYALVSEQIACNAKAARRPAQSAKPLTSNTKSKTATMAKKKPTTAAKPKPATKPKPKAKPAASKKKPTAKPANASSNALVTYLNKIDATNIGKLTAGKKTIET